MMFLSPLINKKLSLVAGMAIGIGWPRFAGKCAKKRVNQPIEIPPRNMKPVIK